MDLYVIYHFIYYQMALWLQIVSPLLWCLLPPDGDYVHCPIVFFFE